MVPKMFLFTLTDYDEVVVRNAATRLLEGVHGDEGTAEFIESILMDIDDSLKIILSKALTASLVDSGIRNWGINAVDGGTE